MANSSKIKPETFLQQIDEAAREAFNKWRKDGLPAEIEKSNINNLWYAQKLLKKLRNSKKIFKNKVSKRIHENLQDKYRDLPQYRRRIKLLPEFIEQTKEIIEDTISTIGCPINLPKEIATGITNPYLKKPNTQKLRLLNPETKMEEKDPNKVAQQLGNFWEGIFGKERPNSQKKMEELLEDYPEISQEDDFTIDPKLVTKIISKTNRTGSGPNGIPFSYYKAMHDEFPSFWPDFIEAAIS